MSFEKPRRQDDDGGREYDSANPKHDPHPSEFGRWYDNDSNGKRVFTSKEAKNPKVWVAAPKDDVVDLIQHR